jgi:hypothetical protein
LLLNKNLKFSLECHDRILARFEGKVSLAVEPFWARVLGVFAGLQQILLD